MKRRQFNPFLSGLAIKQRRANKIGVVASIAAALEAGPRIRAEQEPCADRVRRPCK